MKASVYGILLACGIASSIPVLADEGYPIRAKVIYGLEEEVFIRDLGIRLPAKIDTGAESISLSAINVEHFERGEDDDWVRFDLAVEGVNDLVGIEMPLSRHVRIKRRASDYEEGEEKHYTRRPVVEMTICIGGREAKLDVNLADRRNFSSPMLIGSEALSALDALVDPEVEFAKGAPRCPGAEKARMAGEEDSDRPPEPVMQESNTGGTADAAEATDDVPEPDDSGAPQDDDNDN